MTQNITRENLAQFYGSEGQYYHPIFRGINYTDGVKFLNNEGAGWLIDAILSHLAFTTQVRRAEFVCIILTVEKMSTGRHQARLTFTDGNDRDLYVQDIEYTDFPLVGELKFFCVDKMLMLATEY